MQKIFKFNPFVLVLLIGCQHAPSRQPSSIDPHVSLALQEAYQGKLSSGKAPERSVKIIQQAFLEQTEPISLPTYHEKNWRDQEQTLIVSSPEEFEIEEGHIQSIFNLDRSQTKSFLVNLYNRIPSKLNGKKEDVDLTYHQAKLSCDGSFRLETTFSKYKGHAGQSVDFKFYDGKYRNIQYKLVLLSDVKSCELVMFDKEKKIKYGVKIQEPQDPYEDLHRYVDNCLLPQAPQRATAMQKIFLTDDFPSISCPQSVGKIVNMSDAVESLTLKAELLLGQKLSGDFLKKRDPYADLDFSKAPQFDGIYVSYLVFRADFFGTLMARLLEFHASRGTKIKILVAEVITLDKDEVLLGKLIRKNSNIELQKLKYNPEGDGIGGRLSSLHRTMHQKMFVTLSKTEADLNVAFIGGRNIHDGFVFREPFDYPNPDMVNYVKGDEGFVHWRDFEFKIISKEFSEKAVSHMLTVWDRDFHTMKIRPLNVNIPLKGSVSSSYFTGSKPLIRHLLSIPYRDDQVLERFYVKLIDSAQKSIKISTPYFRPPKSIFEALDRASERGVKVTIITRLDLKGDTVDWLLSEANRPAINLLWRNVDVFEYTEPKVILHSKIVLIDDELSVLGSVNWNKRSFIHDIENAVMVYGRDYNEEMTDLYNEYKGNSRIIEERLKRNYFKGLILKIFDSAF